MARMLGFAPTSAKDRIIQSRPDLDKFFPVPDSGMKGVGVKELLHPDASVEDTVRLMIDVVNKDAYLLKDAVHLIEGRTIRETARNIYNFVVRNIKYSTEKGEQLRNPLVTYHLGQRKAREFYDQHLYYNPDYSADCDDMSIMVELHEDMPDVAYFNENEFDELVEGLGRIPRGRKRRKAFSRLASAKRDGRAVVVPMRKQDTKDLTGKALAEKYAKYIEDESIKKGLRDSSLTWLPHAVYSIKTAHATKTVKMFEPGDKYAAGVTNINGGQLKAGEAMVVTHIQLLSDVSTGTTSALGMECDFGEITARISNGEFSFENGQKPLIAKSGNQVFKTANTSKDEGMYELEAPKVIQAATDIIFDIETGAAIADYTFIKVVLHGMIVGKA